MRASEAVARTYENLAQKADPDRPLADYGTAFDSGRNGTDVRAAETDATGAARIEAPPDALPHAAIPYLGQLILPQADSFLVSDQIFTSLDAAKRYVDILNEDT